MRRVAFKATLWSSAALISISVWRATTLLLSDISAEWTADAVDTYAGKAAHWTILALITLGYLLHTLRRKRKKRHPVNQRGIITRHPHPKRRLRPWHGRLAHASLHHEHHRAF